MVRLALCPRGPWQRAKTCLGARAFHLVHLPRSLPRFTLLLASTITPSFETLHFPRYDTSSKVYSVPGQAKCGCIGRQRIHPLCSHTVDHQRTSRHYEALERARPAIEKEVREISQHLGDLDKSVYRD